MDSSSSGIDIVGLAETLWRWRRILLTSIVIVMVLAWLAAKREPTFTEKLQSVIQDKQQPCGNVRSFRRLGSDETGTAYIVNCGSDGVYQMLETPDGRWDLTRFPYRRLLKT